MSIGVSSQAAGHKTLVPQLIAALKAERGGRHRRGLRRRHPGAGLRVLEKCRRGGDLRPGHQHTKGGGGDPWLDPTPTKSRLAFKWMIRPAGMGEILAGGS